MQHSTLQKPHAPGRSQEQADPQSHQERVPENATCSEAEKPWGGQGELEALVALGFGMEMPSCSPQQGASGAGQRPCNTELLAHCPREEA